MMPIRSFGRASINLRVTSRIASTRVACSPPIVKSLVSIDPETSSTSMMSIPLASIWVRLLPSCGRASAKTKTANVASNSERRIFPARDALCFPISASGLVEEKSKAAIAPRFPRKYASSGMAKRSKSSQGLANVRAVLAGHHSGSCKLTSMDKARRFVEQHSTVRCCCLVTRELDQVTSIQKVFQQLPFTFRKR